MTEWLAKGADETYDDQTIVYPRDVYVRIRTRRGAQIVKRMWTSKDLKTS